MGSDEGGSWWYHNRQRAVPIDDDAVRDFLGKLANDLAEGRELAVLVASDAALRKAHLEFRGESKTTDVLSFPDGEDGRLGDILISAPRAARQAEERGHSPTDEVRLLALHGLLHLLGYDHETDDGAMAKVEMQLRKKYGLGVGLIERAEAC